MKVICKVRECSYCSPNGFCNKDIVFMTPWGYCGRIYDSVTNKEKFGWNTPVEEQEKKEERIQEINEEDN